ncbi:MAG TPA: DUF72 domain-containing protein [Nitrolancea sp.]|nr:DUF72 domain-containing protein [Nitrolancea sp.]
MSKLLIGTSAWSDHDPFYPPGLKPAEQLSFYAKHFPIVEVNTSYYRVPSRRTVEGWVSRSPDGFIFDVKPPRELTSTPEEPHGKKPEPDADLASAFADAIEPLREAGKLGAITFQFPPSYRNTEEHQEYIKLLPELLPGFAISVEFRRRDWLDDEHADQTLALLEDAGLSFTMADEPQMGSGSVPPVFGVTNPKVAIIRFHGRNYQTWYHFTGSSRDRFNWEYQPAELEEWRSKIESASAIAETVHIFFNTNYGDQGPRNAYVLMDMLDIEHPLLPTAPEQRSLFDE